MKADARAVRQLATEYGELSGDPEAFENALHRPMPVFIWSHPQRISPENLAEFLQEDGFRTEPLAWQPGAFRITDENGAPPEGIGRHWAYAAGLFHVQEAGSMLPPLILNPRPGERILDMCAAPGNKSMQMALAMMGRGTVAVNDLSSGRLSAVRNAVNRLGTPNICISCADGMNLSKDAGEFDAILVDAPCSCEGTSRRTPQLKLPKDGDHSKWTGPQELLLQQALRRCRIGGRIVYSTCTYSPEENEAVISRLLYRYPDVLRLVPVRIDGLLSSPGFTRGTDGDYLHPDLSGALRLWPHQNDTGGFFLVLLEKTGPLSSARTDLPLISDKERRPMDSDGQFSISDPDEYEGYISSLIRDFGFPRTLFTDLHLLIKPRRAIYAVSRDLRPPELAGRVMGYPLLRLGNRYHKLTTAGAAALGQSATRNVLEMTREQLDAYCRRRMFRETPDQRQALSFPIETSPAKILPTEGGEGSSEAFRGEGGGGKGGGGNDRTVIVRYRGYPLGTASYRRRTGEIASLFPKSRVLPN